MTLCNLCPRRCNTDRATPEGAKRSLCRALGGPDAIDVALVSLHPWEEPVISGPRGAGTVFFSHCNLRCCFCQNHEISTEGRGVTVTRRRLADIFLEQQDRGASCLELVTPGHYTDAIVAALKDAKSRGLALPVAWNSNGYELPESLMKLQGLVDIFMPDLKYFDSTLGEKYSGVPRYFDFASKAIETMFALTGPAQLGEDGLLKKGLVVRHLVLPWQWQDSCQCVDWLWSHFGDNIYLSVMNQYMPLYKACRHPEINRKLTTLEYQKVLRHIRSLGMTKVFRQVGTTSLAKFIPHFDGSGVAPQ